MNKNKVSILITILVLQLVLLVFIYQPSALKDQTTAARDLIGFSLDKVNKIQITSANQKQKESPKILVLQNKKENQNRLWVLPSFYDFPADQDLVVNFLNRLKKISLIWPVSQTKESQQKFLVGEDNFKHKIEIFDENQKLLLSFYLGDSPGLRKVYLRKTESEKVFSVELARFIFQKSAKDWLDKNHLAFDIDQLLKIKLKDHSIQKDSKGNYQLIKGKYADLPQDQKPKINQKKLKSKIKALAKLKFTDYLDIKQTKALNLSFANKPTYTLEFKDGTKKVYRVSDVLKKKKPQNESFVVLSFDKKSPHYFKVKQADLDIIFEIEKFLIFPQPVDTDAKAEETKEEANSR